METSDFKEESVPIVCNECKKQFSLKGNLKKHFLKTHPEKDFEPVKEFQFPCEDCSCKYNTKKSLDAHKRLKHGQKEKIKELHRCFMCPVELEKNNLINHYENEHNIDTREEILSFSTYEDVIRWKENLEKENNVKFIVDRGTKKNNAGIKHYFKCHRSGQYNSKSTGIRRIKIQGSIKSNFLCPSRITVTEAADGSCNVKYVKTHIGHDMELKHLKLSTTKRQAKAKKAMKIPLDSILDSVRDPISEYDCLQRLHLLTKQDLYNIECSFNLGATKHSNDATSVDLLVRDLEKSSSDYCILLYKPQGSLLEKEPSLKVDDFSLVIMNQVQREMLKKYGADCVCIDFDGTHGLNDYGFQLITLLVIDDMRESFPCALFISNREDEAALSVFFRCIFTEIGKITPKVFMSDMATSFYNAWSAVMGVPKQHLYCLWHVDRAWRTNLQLKIWNKEKQKIVYKLLRTLLEERDEVALTSMLQTAIAELYSDEETAAFAQYFKTHYVENLEKWAFCHRLHSGLNTNMHLERMHKTIKYIYLKGKTVKTLDKTLLALMCFLRNKIVERVDKGKDSTKLKNLRKRHQESCNFDTIINKCNEGWNVLSSEGKELYMVQRREKKCSECKLYCSFCDACIHDYLCSCPENAIKWNMCKHIHKVCMFLKNENTSIMDQSGDLKICESAEAAEFLLKQLKNPSTSEPIENEKSRLKMEWGNIISSSSKKQLEYIKKTLSHVKAVLPTIDDETSTTQFTSKNESANKNFDLQRKFLSKKRKLNNSVMMPSAEERINIL